MFTKIKLLLNIILLAIEYTNTNTNIVYKYTMFKRFKISLKLIYV